MKRITFAAGLLVFATMPFAQPAEVPKHKCEPKPVFPAGAALMAQETRRKAFDRDLENYKKCMTAYFDERKAMHEANAALHKSAIEEYNATVKAINEAQEAAR